MSDIKSKILETQKAKKMKSEFVATTVRIPKELQLVIEDLAEYLSISKQDVMLDLIKEGMKVAEDALAEDDINDKISTNFHVLNTNKRYDSGAQKEMLDKGIVAAFYGKCKRQINKIQKNDTVFLYENGVGIVAYGKGSGETLKKDYEGETDECHYQKLIDFVVLETPLPAAKIKKILDRNVVFLPVRSSMPDGQKVLDAIAG
ncbi:hypothetical protein [Psychrobacter urativorans]|uniref:Uncharacterized protein n=1 Tax=Psychrobacter urativorans TaxID=45610 RepID=A0A0M4T3B4_9GAMM|nr:hypothetical protein [Psychrobacter urativorans]ALF60252.1 hypothetical protein AOC03_09565 [Psychrobacter urativorans]